MIATARKTSSSRRADRLTLTRPTTPDSLYFWVYRVLGMKIPRVAICPGHCAPFDYLRDAFFERFSSAVVWANRGGGKTMLGAIVTLLDALFKPGVSIRILGGSLEQSQKMYRYLTRLALPRFAAQIKGRGRHGRAGSAGRRAMHFRNGSEVEILAQSECSVRGNRVQKMRCDEIELFDTDIWTSCQLVTESRAEEASMDDGRGTDEIPPLPLGEGRVAAGDSPWRGEGALIPPLPLGEGRGEGALIPPLPLGEGRGEGALRNATRGNPGRSGAPSPGLKATLSQGERGNSPRIIRGAVEAFSTLHRPHGLMQKAVERANAAGSPVYRWCVLDVIERCPADRSCASCPLAEDCRGVARRADGYFRIDDAIAARARVSRDTWEAEMLCLRPSRRGAVFPSFSRERHVQKLRWHVGWPLFRAVDFGFANPFVCLWVQVSPEGDVRVLGEYVRARVTVAEHARRVRELDPGPVKMTYCDPAGSQREQITGSSSRAELHAAGMPTRARRSFITDGLDTIRRYLEGEGPATPTLRIDPGCRLLIESLEAYHYPDDAEGSETPVKDNVHDHQIDALRYFFVNHVGTRSGKVRERLY